MTYRERLQNPGKDLIAMIHLPALPGTPGSRLTPGDLAAAARAEALLYRDAGFGTVMIENMHDVPYVKHAGPEIVAAMTLAGRAVKEVGLACGVQVLAGCNKEALAVAHAAGLDFIRAEGYVFGHVGDEGWFESCAGDLLRYRRAIGAEDVLVFVDIKKKHSSHAVTADVSLAETARAARFFLADGVVVTGVATGHAADVEALATLRDVPLPKLVGSGLTPANLCDYWDLASGFIVGSYLKRDGLWSNAPDPARVAAMVSAFRELSRAAGPRTGPGPARRPAASRPGASSRPAGRAARPGRR